MRNCKNVLHYIFGQGSFNQVESFVTRKRNAENKSIIYCLDHYFKNNGLANRLPLSDWDQVIYVDTSKEPFTPYINTIVKGLREEQRLKPGAVVGIGGGSTLDTAKAVSILLTNTGWAEDYQGWDLVKNPGLYMIGIPSISGTGAESSRTCVMINPERGIKLGMNSDYSVFDQLILDPELTSTVPRNQYFYTGLDTYIHCLESLNGRYRNAIGDAFSQQAMLLSKEVFLSEDMLSEENRAKLMVASYLGGCAIASSYVGVVHPFSAGLGVVLGIHHGLANCLVMTVMDEFYPKEVEIFWEMVEEQQVEIPRGLFKNLTETQYDKLYNSIIVHEKPLANALGDNFRDILTKEKVVKIFMAM
ncbi:MAG: iron-containing alcohol dehydrogenase family protein [Thermodesulfobacteriota bacterium]